MGPGDVLNAEQIKFFQAAFKEKTAKGKKKSKKGASAEDEDEEDQIIEVEIPETIVPPPKKFNRAPSFLLPEHCISPLKENAFAQDDEDDEDEDEEMEEEEKCPPRKAPKARISVGEKAGTSGMTR